MCDCCKTNTPFHKKIKLSGGGHVMFRTWTTWNNWIHSVFYQKIRKENVWPSLCDLSWKHLCREWTPHPRVIFVCLPRPSAVMPEPNHKTLVQSWNDTCMRDCSIAYTNTSADMFTIKIFMSCLLHWFTYKFTYDHYVDKNNNPIANMFPRNTYFWIQISCIQT